MESTPEEHEPPEDFLRIITPDAQNLSSPNLASIEGQAVLEPCITNTELIVADNLSCLMRGDNFFDSYIDDCKLYDRIGSNSIAPDELYKYIKNLDYDAKIEESSIDEEISIYGNEFLYE